jgi:hypothetical protein
MIILRLSSAQEVLKREAHLNAGGIIDHEAPRERWFVAVEK